jgi:hypothetical protein
VAGLRSGIPNVAGRGVFFLFRHSAWTGRILGLTASSSVGTGAANHSPPSSARY